MADFPDEVQDEVGHHLYEAQQGLKPANAKPLKGYGGPACLRLLKTLTRTPTYRAAYTVEFQEAIYVLHCFMKKSKRGAETPRQDAELIDRRYKQAQEEHKRWQKENQ